MTSLKFNPLRGGDFRIVASEYGYTLQVTPSELRPVSGKHLHFTVYDAQRKYGYSITGRNLYQYYPFTEVQGIAAHPDPHFQYLEVGAGMGEFIPRLAQQPGLTHRPIVVDPANYPLMIDMLQEALPRVHHTWIQEQIKELTGNCAIITNAAKVNLINLPLQEAMVTYPELWQCADVVVDSYGPTYWHNGSTTRMIEDLEGKLLKEAGVLLTWYNRFRKEGDYLRESLIF